MTRRIAIPVLSSAVAVAMALASVGSVLAQDPTTAPDASAPAQEAWTSSIVVPTDEAQQEADEAAALQALATVTPDGASAAALASTPGEVTSVQLDAENGNVVYSVLITDDTGALMDVKVDAGNATVLEAKPAGDEANAEGDATEAGDEDTAEGTDSAEGSGEGAEAADNEDD